MNAGGVIDVTVNEHIECSFSYNTLENFIWIVCLWDDKIFFSLHTKNHPNNEAEVFVGSAAILFLYSSYSLLLSLSLSYGFECVCVVNNSICAC